MSIKIPCGGFCVDGTTIYFDENKVLHVNVGGANEEIALSEDSNSATYSAKGVEIDDGVNRTFVGLLDNGAHGISSTTEIELDGVGMHINMPVYLESPDGTTYKVTMNNGGTFNIVEYVEG